MFFRADRRKAGSQRCAELRGFGSKNFSDLRRDHEKGSFLASARVKSFKPVFLALTTVLRRLPKMSAYSGSTRTRRRLVTNASPRMIEEAISEPNEEIDVDHHPEQPGGKS